MEFNLQNQNNFDMSEKQLKFAYWFVTHKILLKRIFFVVSFTISSLLLLYGIYGFVDYFLISGPKERKLISQLPKTLINQEVIYRQRAQSLEILNTYLLPSAGKYDIVAKIRNPNDKWYAEFDYNFLVDGKEVGARKSFILPKEEKFVFELAFEAPQGAKTVSLSINNIQWRKINPHQIPDYSEWAKVHLNFPVFDISFDGAVKTDQKIFSEANFKVTNSTAFDFWQVNFKVILYRGPVIAGVNFVTVDRFYVGERRGLVARWYEPIFGVTRVEVYPEVNVFDKKNYIK
jgi:hypothetical protein